MRLGKAGVHDIISHLPGEWNIEEMVSVSMTEFSPPKTVLHTPAPVLANGARETMWRGGHPFPSEKRFCNIFLGIRDRHKFACW
jgi:hypothetical protein